MSNATLAGVALHLPLIGQEAAPCALLRCFLLQFPGWFLRITRFIFSMALTDRIVIVIILIYHLASEELKALYKFENYLIISQQPRERREAAERGSLEQLEDLLASAGQHMTTAGPGPFRLLSVVLQDKEEEEDNLGVWRGGRRRGTLSPKDKIQWEGDELCTVFFKDAQNEEKQEAPRGFG